MRCRNFAREAEGDGEDEVASLRQFEVLEAGNVVGGETVEILFDPRRTTLVS